MGTRFRILNHFLVRKFGVFQGWFRIFLQFSGILLAKCAGFFQSHFCLAKLTLTSLSGGNCLKMFAVAVLRQSWHDGTVWFTKNLGFLKWMLIGQAPLHFGGRGRNMWDKCVVEWCVGTLWLWREKMGYAFLKGVRDRRCGTLCTPRV